MGKSDESREHKTRIAEQIGCAANARQPGCGRLYRNARQSRLLLLQIKRLIVPIRIKLGAPILCARLDARTR